MSNPNHDETPPPIAAETPDEAATPRKRAARKTAAKTAVKKTAARKPRSSTTTETVAADHPVEAAPAAPAEARPARKTTRTRKSPPADNAAAETRADHTGSHHDSHSHPEPTAEPTPPRFGRVPGGGPIPPRDATPAAETQAPQADPQASADSSRGTHQGPHGQNQGQHPANRDGQGRDGQQRDGQGRESRSKRRRDKRKRRAERQQQGQGGRPEPHGPEPMGQEPDRRPPQLNGPKIEADGMLELAPKGFGFLRVPSKHFDQARDDVFVTPESIRKYNLRVGQWIHGLYQEGPRGPQLVEVTQINGMPPEEASKLPHFDELKAVNPSKRISFETTANRFTTRVVDIMAPVGRGQRGLIVSPPRSGKTTLLLHMAEAIREKYEDTIHLMVLLVDERPEEVTEFRRALPGAEIYASSNDEQARSHCRIAELAIERAKRLVEAGKDVFLLMDSITRLARAYNQSMNHRGRGTGSGGITIGALEVPRRLFAAARNTRGGGSLTILATALIQTNSRADEAIFMEFKGTGNMELVLDRKIAENYIYPAVDIFKSGTRREELLLPDHMLHKIHLIRRGLSGHRPVEAMERLLFFLKKFPNNPQMLLEIKG
jgi:transcription termination factor Rho